MSVNIYNWFQVPSDQDRSYFDHSKSDKHSRLDELIDQLRADIIKIGASKRIRAALEEDTNQENILKNVHAIALEVEIPKKIRIDIQEADTLEKVRKIIQDTLRDELEFTPPIVCKLSQAVYHTRPVCWIMNQPNEKSIISTDILNHFHQHVTSIPEGMEEEFQFLTEELSQQKLTMQKTYYLFVLAEHILRIWLQSTPIPLDLQVRRIPISPLFAISYHFTKDPALIIQDGPKERLKAAIEGQTDRLLRNAELTDQICITLSVHNNIFYNHGLIRHCIDLLQSQFHWTDTITPDKSDLFEIRTIIGTMRTGDQLRPVGMHELSHFALWKLMGPLVYCHSEPLVPEVLSLIRSQLNVNSCMGHIELMSSIEDAILNGFIRHDGFPLDAISSWLDLNNRNYINKLLPKIPPSLSQEVRKAFCHLLNSEYELLQKEYGDFCESHAQVSENEIVHIMMKTLRKRCLPLEICVSKNLTISALDVLLKRLRSDMQEHLEFIKEGYSQMSFDSLEDALSALENLLKDTPDIGDELDYTEIAPELIVQLRAHLKSQEQHITSSSISTSSTSNKPNGYNKRDRQEDHEKSSKRSKVNITEQVLYALEFLRNQAIRDFEDFMRQSYASMPFLCETAVESNLRNCIREGARKAAFHFYHIWWYQVRPTEQTHMLNQESVNARQRLISVGSTWNSQSRIPRPAYEHAIEYAVIEYLEKISVQNVDFSQAIQEIRKNLIEKIPIFFPLDSQLAGPLKKAMRFFLEERQKIYQKIHLSLATMPFSVLQLIFQYHIPTNAHTDTISNAMPALKSVQQMPSSAFSAYSLLASYSLDSSSSSHASPNPMLSLSSSSSGIHHSPTASSSNSASPVPEPTIVSLSSLPSNVIHPFPAASSSSRPASPHPIPSVTSLSIQTIPTNSPIPMLSSLQSSMIPSSFSPSMAILQTSSSTDSIPVAYPEMVHFEC